MAENNATEWTEINMALVHSLREQRGPRGIGRSRQPGASGVPPDEGGDGVSTDRKALEAMIQKAYEHGYARGHGHAETGEPFEPADAATQYMNTPPRAVREALAASEPTAPAIPQTQKALPDGRRRCQHWYGDHTKAVQCNREWGHPERYHRAVGNGLEWEDGDDTDNEGRPTAPSEPTAPRHHVYQDGLTLSGTGKTVPHAGVTTHTSEPRTFELKQTWTIRGSGLHLLTTFDGRTIWDGPPPLPYSPTDTEAETDNRVPEPTGVGEAEYERVESHIRCAFAAGYTLSAHHRPYDGEDDRGEPAAWDEYREHFNPTRLLLATHTQRADDE